MELGLGCLPILWSMFSLGAPILNYAIAVHNGHVYPFLPAISDTGSNSPESNLLSTLLNLSMLICLLSIYVRYYQCGVQIKYCTDIRDTLARLNAIAALLAGFSMFGGIVVSNFEPKQDAVLTGIHDVGAVLMFTFGIFYFWIQTRISYLMKPYGIYSSCLCHVRLILTTIASLCSIAFFTASTYGHELFILSNHNHVISQWRPGDGGYKLHLIANLCEWITLFAFAGMSLSFACEFQRVSIEVKCTEKRPYIISAHSEFSEYSSLKLNSEERTFSDEDQNQ